MTVYYQPGSGLNKCKQEQSCSCKCNCNCNCNCKPPIDCKPEKIIFKCNNLSGANGISVFALGDVVRPRNIGSITVSGLSCFKKPCVKIDVLAMVSIGTAIAVGTTITFRVFKRCGNGEEIEVQSFSLMEGLDIAEVSAKPVAFSICDCDGCISDCCVYRVTVEATSEVAIVSAISINQGTISAVASDMC